MKKDFLNFHFTSVCLLESASHVLVCSWCRYLFDCMKFQGPIIRECCILCVNVYLPLRNTYFRIQKMTIEHLKGCLFSYVYKQLPRNVKMEIGAAEAKGKMIFSMGSSFASKGSFLFFLNGPFPAFFLYFRLLNTQLTVNNSSIYK